VAGQATPGIRVRSPSYGASATLGTAVGAIEQIHRRFTPYLLVPSGTPPSVTTPARAAPPEPYDPALVAQGILDADAELDDTRAFPEQLFMLGGDYAKQFLAIRSSLDYNDAGRTRQLNALGANLNAAAQTLTDRLVQRFNLIAKHWVDQARDAGRALMVGKGVPPDVMQLVAMCATAPIALVIALLEQLTPQAPDDPGDQLRRENVAATLYLRKPEWAVSPRVAEQALAAFRRAQAKDRTKEFYGGLYVAQRLDRMSRAWMAAVGSLLSHGSLDPALRLPLSVAFERPDADAARALVLAALPQDDADILQAYGLQPADMSGIAPRSSEAGGPIRLTDAGSRAT
jgi:hypothetical protein